MDVQVRWKEGRAEELEDTMHNSTQLIDHTKFAITTSLQNVADEEDVTA